jgi:hypothetical protein
MEGPREASARVLLVVVVATVAGGSRLMPDPAECGAPDGR